MADNKKDEDIFWDYIGKVTHNVNGEESRLRCLLILLKNKDTQYYKCTQEMHIEVEKCATRLSECRETLRILLRDLR